MAVGTGWLGVESPACTLGEDWPSSGSLSATHQMGGHRSRTVKKKRQFGEEQGKLGWEKQREKLNKGSSGSIFGENIFDDDFRQKQEGFVPAGVTFVIHFH